VNQNDLSLFVYETIDNPQKRSGFLATLAGIIGANAAAIKLEDAQLRWASMPATHGMDRAAIDSYCQYYVSLNPWALRGVSIPGEVRTSDELLSEAKLRETEFYRGWMQPRGWGHSAAVSLASSEHGRCILFAFRSPNHPFTEKELTVITGLAPHLAMAAQIERRLRELKHTINRLRNGAVQTDTLTRFNLSPTEARIALAIAQGQSPKEYAHRAGVTIDTVRWHVKRIHKKLGVNRQADLVRLLLDHSRQ
jgi:DNA-binding CsgD family transcriptional regulator